MSIFVSPYVNELRLADNAMVLLPWVKESVNPDLDRAVAVQFVNFERARHQLALDLSTKIVLDGINDLRTTHHQAGLVVIKLRVVGPERSFDFHVTVIDRIENLLIELRDGAEELG